MMGGCDDGGVGGGVFGNAEYAGCGEPVVWG